MTTTTKYVRKNFHWTFAMIISTVLCAINFGGLLVLLSLALKVFEKS